MADHTIPFPAPVQPADSMTRLSLDMTTRGNTGLNRLGGFIHEEQIDCLNGLDGVAIYKKMGDYDPVLSGILRLMDVMVRQVGWRVDAASSRGQDQEAADFLESCMGDMSMSWIDTISEIMSMCQYGHSLHELVFKRRCGNSPEKAMRSKYADGRIGWRQIPIRSQDTLTKWDFDEAGDIRGVVQRGPPTWVQNYLPMGKCLLFRTRVHKNNPLGMSLLKGAYTSWYKKNALERFEGIGIERELTGLPVAWAPMEIISANANSPGAVATQRELKNIVTNIRADEQGGLLLPLEYDDQGHKLFDFGLMSSSGSRAINTGEVIQRHDHRMAMSLLADFVLMGQSSSSTGSLAMHQDKSGIFGRSISSLLDIIQETLQVGVARLMAFNDFAIHDNPRIVHDSVDSVDMSQLSDVLVKLSSAGMPLFPNPELEKRIYELADLPAPLDMEMPTRQSPAALQEPLGASPTMPVSEQHDSAGMESSEDLAPVPADDKTDPSPQEKALIEHLTQQARARNQAASSALRTRLFA